MRSQCTSVWSRRLVDGSVLAKVGYTDACVYICIRIYMYMYASMFMYEYMYMFM